MRKKPCRAFACPRRVYPDQLLCNVHIKLLPAKMLAPIADNRTPNDDDETIVARSVRDGVFRAVEYIAKQEGTASELQRAIKSNSTSTTDAGRITTDQSRGRNQRGVPLYVEPY